MTHDRPYHQGMEGNTPPDGAPHASQQPAPNDAPTAPPWPPPAYSYPYPAPAPPAARSGRSLWIIFAGIVIAGALIAGAAFLALSGKDTTAPIASPTALPITPSEPTSAAGSSTCKAWKTTRATLDTIPELPAGWDWNTPNIDTYISNRNAATAKALDLFEPKIAETPAEVAAAARDYVTAKRNSMRLLAEKSFTSADAVSVNAARAQLDQLCDVS